MPSPAQTAPLQHQEQLVEPPEEAVSTPLEQTTLVQNEEESFALAPVDASALKGIFQSFFIMNANRIVKIDLASAS